MKNYNRNFDIWNEEKKRLDNTKRDLYFNEREIWWCKLGLNIGDEEDGTNQDYQRPVLILRGMSKNTCYIVPLTTSPSNHKYRQG